jgi:hypothetical protein
MKERTETSKYGSIWPQKPIDNIFRDHIKRCPMCIAYIHSLYDSGIRTHDLSVVSHLL